MIKVLFLPHAFPHPKLKTRTSELTRELAKDDRFAVFVLSRSPSPLNDLTYGVRHCFSRAQTISWREDRLTFVRIPYVPGMIPALFPYNRRLLERLLRTLGIHVVINSFAHSLPVSPDRRRVKIYDLTDDYASFHRNPFVRAMISSYIRRELQTSDALTAVSLSLGERIRKKGWRRDFIWIPNGVDADRFRMFSSEAVDSIRSRYGLRNKLVIGHIGFQDRFSGLDFLLEVFERAQRAESQLALLVVGPGGEAERLRLRYAHNPSIVFAGPVDPDKISPFFMAVDIGVLPYEPSPSVHSRFPLRLAEFIAARKIVVAWPFGDLPKLRLPNVVLAKRTPDAWVDAILKAKDLAWSPSWEDLRRQFSLSHVAGTLKDLILRLLINKRIAL